MTLIHPGVILPKDGPKSQEGNSLWVQFRRKAAMRSAKILLVEAEDPRVLSAARYLLNQKIAQPILVGDPARIRIAAENFGMDVEGVEWLDPLTHKDRFAFCRALFERRKAKGLTEDQARRLVEDPLYFGVMALGRDWATDLSAARYE